MMQESGDPFSALLRRYRQAAALSQEDLARRAGMSVAAISTLERGRRTSPRPDTLQLLAAALELTPEQRVAFVASARPGTSPAVPGTDDAAVPLSATPNQRARPDSMAPQPAPFPPALRLIPLPIPPTHLLGREREAAAIAHLARQSVTRLLTLTGPGGVGKTRLALRVADDLAASFPDGVCWVSLAEIQDPALFGSTVLQALGHTESTQMDVLETLIQVLRTRTLLLVLDNCEQLLTDITIVAELLGACPELTILTTSRAPLRLRGEQEFAVAPLATPDRGEEETAERLLQYPAVSLFVQRAAAVKPTFVLTDAMAGGLAELCRRLDGLPLALELAAARVKVLGIEALLDRLGSRLALLTGGARDLPTRQQTLRAAIAWSEELLDEDARRLFRRLGVFVGGCTLAAAEAVRADLSDGDVFAELSSLVDHSLVQSVETETIREPRFSMLETIREYALSRLEAKGELVILRERHLTWCLDLAEQAVAALAGSEQARWLRRLEDEHDNLRAALDWSLDVTRPTHDLAAVQLAGALHQFWFIHAHLSEGRRRLDAALSAVDWSLMSVDPSPQVIRALHAAGHLAFMEGDFDRALSLHDRTIALCRLSGDRERLGGALITTAITYQELGRFVEAAALLRESLRIADERGDLNGRGRVLNTLGDAALRQGDLRGAVAPLEESLAAFRAVGNKRGTGAAAGNLGTVWQQAGDNGRAAPLLGESLRLYDDLGDKLGCAWCLEVLVWLCHVAGRSARAACLLGAVATLRRLANTPLEPNSRVAYDAIVRMIRADLGEASWTQEWARGASLDTSAMVALALREVEDTLAPSTNSARELSPTNV